MKKTQGEYWIYTLQILAPEGLNLDPWILQLKIIHVGVVFYYNINITLTQVGTRSTGSLELSEQSRNSQFEGQQK